MKIRCFKLFIPLFILLLAACAPQRLPDGNSPVSNPPPGGSEPTPQPTPDYNPRPADENWRRDTAFVDEFQILILESYPPQYRLSLTGNLPTPCHQLRVLVKPPDAQNILAVSVYSVTPPNQMCAQVLSPFQASIPLDGAAPGQYAVTVNGQDAGSIDIPQPLQ